MKLFKQCLLFRAFTVSSGSTIYAYAVAKDIAFVGKKNINMQSSSRQNLHFLVCSFTSGTLHSVPDMLYGPLQLSDHPLIRHALWKRKTIASNFRPFLHSSLSFFIVSRELRDRVGEKKAEHFSRNAHDSIRACSL